MRAEPFDDARSSDARRDFRNLLSDVIKANHSISDALSDPHSDGEQLTSAMQDMREKYLRSVVASICCIETVGCYLHVLRTLLV